MRNKLEIIGSIITASILLFPAVASASLTLSGTAVTSDAGLTLNGAAGSAITLGSANVAGTLTLGGTTQTGDVLIGQSTQNNYVKIGSGLPKKSVEVKSGVLSSLNVISYGGNHMTLPPFGPFSQTGKSS